MIKGKKAIVLLNKTDLNMVTTEEQLKGKVDHPVISISAKEKTGMEQLEQTLKTMFFHGNIRNLMMKYTSQMYGRNRPWKRQKRV